MAKTSTRSLQCDNADLRGELIRDRFVVDLRDFRTSERLQLTADLDLDKAITIGCQAQMQAKKNRAPKYEAMSTNEVNRVNSQAQIKNNDNCKRVERTDENKRDP